MRHGKTFNHLGRTSSHRKALLKNLANSLILNKRIETTVAKAKELRKYVEPLLTKSKEDNTSNRRLLFSYLQDKEAVKILFGEVSDKIANRQGGYTRIIKLGARLGDNAEMALIELVDFNETYKKEGSAAKAKTRRSRRGSGKAANESAVAAAPVADEVVSPTVEEAPSAEVVEEEVAAVTVAEAVVEAQVEDVPIVEASTETTDEASADEASEEEKKGNE
jgi:large subunit ribosomal protein L17